MNCSYVRDLVVVSFGNVNTHDSTPNKTIVHVKSTEELMKKFILLMSNICTRVYPDSEITYVETKFDTKNNTIAIDCYNNKDNLPYTHFVEVDMCKLIGSTKKFTWYVYNYNNKDIEQISKTVPYFCSNITELFTEYKYNSSEEYKVMTDYWNICIPCILKFIAYTTYWYNKDNDNTSKFEHIQYRGVGTRNHICFYGSLDTIVSTTPKSIVTNTNDIYLGGFRILISRKLCTYFFKDATSIGRIKKICISISDKLSTRYRHYYWEIGNIIKKSDKDNVTININNFFITNRLYSDLIEVDETNTSSIEEIVEVVDTDTNDDITSSIEIDPNARINSYVEKVIDSIVQFEKKYTKESINTITKEEIEEDNNTLIEYILNNEYDDLLNDISYSFSITNWNRIGTPSFCCVGIDIKYKNKSIIEANFNINNNNIIKVIPYGGYVIYGTNKSMIHRYYGSNYNCCRRESGDKVYLRFKEEIYNNPIFETIPYGKRVRDNLLTKISVSSEFRIINEFLKEDNAKAFIIPANISREYFEAGIMLTTSDNGVVTTSEYRCIRIPII